MLINNYFFIFFKRLLYKMAVMRGKRVMIMVPARRKPTMGRPMVMARRGPAGRPIGLPKPRRAPTGRRPY
jgi:hypothetical protein